MKLWTKDLILSSKIYTNVTKSLEISISKMDTETKIVMPIDNILQVIKQNEINKVKRGLKH